MEKGSIKFGFSLTKVRLLKSSSKEATSAHGNQVHELRIFSDSVKLGPNYFLISFSNDLTSLIKLVGQLVVKIFYIGHQIRICPKYGKKWTPRWPLRHPPSVFGNVHASSMHGQRPHHGRRVSLPPPHSLGVDAEPPALSLTLSPSPSHSPSSRTRALEPGPPAEAPWHCHGPSAFLLHPG